MKKLLVLLAALWSAVVLAAAAQPSEVLTPKVTPVKGQSWLKHLGLTIEQTHMGQMGGQAPAPETQRKEPTPEASGESTFTRLIERIFDLFRRGRGEEAKQKPMNAPFTITGADLYRLNCRSCHGPDGTGAPPEIKSLIGPVRGTSPALIQARMKKLGHPVSEQVLKQLADQGTQAIRTRLQNGGKKMPPFRHLKGAEVDSLLMYLKQLAGVPKSEWHPIPVTESVARVGEHLVKGTCPVCHSATGPGAGRMMTMRGVIPSLASIPAEMSPGMVDQKVRYGMRGMAAMMGFRPRMPVFSYLTEPEVLAAYLYLESYAPQP